MDIVDGKVLQEFQNWGKLYSVEFEITVTNPGSGWTNVFQFAPGIGGGRIPAFFINSDGYFHICSAVSDNKNYCYNFFFELEKQHQITIKQFNSSGKYWYEIIIDGESKIKKENTQPKSFASVNFYASNGVENTFSTDLGSICNVNIQNDEV